MLGTSDEEKTMGKLSLIIKEAQSLDPLYQEAILKSQNVKLIYQLAQRRDLDYGVSCLIYEKYAHIDQILLALAKNPTTHLSLLEKMMKSPLVEVRRALVINPSIPRTVLRNIFYYDKDFIVRKLARQVTGN